MVAHHLAKVRVASSNLVIRSVGLLGFTNGGVAERRGSGLQSRLHGFESRRHLGGISLRQVDLSIAGVAGSDSARGSLGLSANGFPVE